MWYISSAHLEHAVHIALVDEAEYFVVDPFEARDNHLDRFLALQVEPTRVQQVCGYSDVHKPVRRLDDIELLLVQVDLELEGEVGREEEGDAGLLGKQFGIPLDPKLNLPLDELAVVFGQIFLRRLDNGGLPQEIAIIIVDGASIVDCCREVVDNLHHAHRILAQIEVLLRFVIDVPLEVLQLVVFIRALLLKDVKEEVESHFAFA